MSEPKFHVGQVVSIETDSYVRGKYRRERFQRVMEVYAWPSKKYPWGYQFGNGDECNERFVRALTKKERE